jgi:hypothetical protein
MDRKSPRVAPSHDEEAIMAGERTDRDVEPIRSFPAHPEDFLPLWSGSPGGAGKVWLLEAGDPERISEVGRGCLRRADAVVYDRSRQAALADAAPSWAERVFTGASSGRGPMPRREVEALLVDLARTGLEVVCLRSIGHATVPPSLPAAGVAWEVVPERHGRPGAVWPILEEAA